MILHNASNGQHFLKIVHVQYSPNSYQSAFFRYDWKRNFDIVCNESPDCIFVKFSSTDQCPNGI